MKVLTIIFLLLCPVVSYATVYEINPDRTIKKHIAKSHLQITQHVIPAKKRAGYSRYQNIIDMASHDHNVPIPVIVEVMRQESGFNECAVSIKGAKGLMQLMPATAKRFGVEDVCNPYQNVMAGTKYLAWLLRRYQGNLPLALAAYNAGEGAVDKYRNIPPYPETQNYVKRIMARISAKNI